MTMRRIPALFLLAFVIFAAAGSSLAQDAKLLKEQFITVKAGDKLKLNSSTGDVYIKSWDKPEAGIRIFGNSKAEEKMAFTVEAADYGVFVEGKKKGSFWDNAFSWNNLKLRYEILLPRQFNLDIATAGGDIYISAIEGTTKGSTSGGDFTIKELKGKTQLSTSGGDISIKNHDGELRASTSGGDITITGQNGDVKATSSGGDLIVHSSNGKLEATTTGGDITGSYNGLNNGIALTTTGGDITITLPSSLKGNITCTTSGGDVSCGLPTTKTIKATTTRFEAELNGGGEVIRCSTTGGDITVQPK